MAGGSSPLSIIPSECFSWRPRVQFIDTFQTRKSAINHALDHGYNLIVERCEGSIHLFDVLLDPDRSCTDGINLEPLHSEEVLLESDTRGWTALMIFTLWDLCKRFATTITSQNCRADVQFTLRRVWKSSSSAVISFSRQFASEAVVLYKQEIVPFIRHTASRCWWSNTAVAFRRWWHRHSQASASDLAKRFTASLDSLYKRQIAPRMRQAVDQYRQQGIAGTLHYARNISRVAFSNLARRFAAAVAVFCNPELVPFILQAGGSLHRTDVERGFSRTVESVAASRHSNSSHLG
jgi:hypothetical protein